MNLPWQRRTTDDAIAVELPCRHTVLVRPEWLDASGRFVGRLGCTTDHCRKVLDGVVLEGWRP